MAFDELRVHGVSGTPPRNMLFTDPVTEARSDDYTKVYRQRSVDEGHDPGARAFHWGGLTAGNRFTALWIFLSPFALSNLAGWLVRKNGRRVRATVRIAGVGLTGVFVTQLLNAVVIVHQWGNSEGWDGTWMIAATTAVALFLTALITGWISTQSHFSPLGSICRLRLLFDPGIRWLTPPAPRDPDDLCEPANVDSWWSRSSCEAGNADAADWRDPADPDTTEWAADPRLWKTHSFLHRMRRLHVAVGLSTVSVLVSLEIGMAGWFQIAVVIPGAAATALVLLASFKPDASWLRRITALTAPTAAILGIMLVILAPSASNPHPDWQIIDDGVFVAVLVFGLAALASVPNGKAVGALALSGFLGASLGLAAIRVLRRGLLGEVPATFVSPNEIELLTTPTESVWVAVWMLRMIIVVITVAAVLSCRKLGPDETFAACHPDEKGVAGRRRIEWLAVRSIRRVTHGAGGVLVAAGVVGAFAAIEMIVRVGLSLDVEKLGLPEWSSVWPLLAVMAGALTYALAPIMILWWSSASGLKKSLYIVTALAVVRLLLIAEVQSFVGDAILRGDRFGMRIHLTDLGDFALTAVVLFPAFFFFRSVTAGWGSGESRRRTGVMWDVVSFWPRFFHPLAPPAYGPHAVSELRQEIARASSEITDDDRFTLSAHSQGSMITALALQQMTSEEVDKIYQVITYGSPIGLIYGHLFGATGLQEITAATAGHQIRWTNLWRPSDYLGGLPIGRLEGQEDHRIINWRADYINHSGYECTRQFRAVKRGLTPEDPDIRIPCGGCPCETSDAVGEDDDLEA